MLSVIVFIAVLIIAIDMILFANDYSCCILAAAFICAAAYFMVAAVGETYTEWVEIKRTEVTRIELTETTVFCHTNDEIVELEQSNVLFLEDSNNTGIHMVIEEREQIPNRWISLGIIKDKEERVLILIPAEGYLRSFFAINKSKKIKA